MKKNFTKAVLLALAVTSMGTFNSCKDHDDCGIDRIELEILKDKNANLEDVVKAQTSQIEDLIKQIEAIKECNCTLTPEQVQEMIDDAIANMVSADEFTSMVLEIINKMGFQTADQVTAAIEKYMAEHPNTGDGTGLTAEQIQQMINTATEKLATQEALEKAVAGLEAALKGAQESVDGKITDLTKVINDLNNAATQAIAQLQTVTTTLSTDVETLKGQLNDIITAWGPKVEEVMKTAADALAMAKQDSAMIATMQEQYEALSAKLDSLANIDHNHTSSYDDTALRNSIDSLANEMKEFATKQALRDVLTAAELMHAEAIEYTKKVEAMTAEKLGELESNFATLEATVSEIKTKVDEIYPMVLENRQYIKGIYGYLQKLITGITIQAVNNPVFGSFAFPWGIQSNILVGYYGESDVDVRFPTTRTANYIYKEYALTDKDAEMLGSSVESYNKFGQSVLVEETEGNAGKVYLTINPTNINFTGTKFSLVNSQDEESPIKLGTLEKSDEVLQFGFTRAADNGFYEATATFSEDNIPSIVIDKSLVFTNLKEIAKDVIDFKNGANIKDAAKRLYNIFLEVNGNLDANGIKASWTSDDVQQSVYSKYAIAATAIQPLSYAFLYDMNIGTSINNKIPNLPTINPISDAILNDLINLDDLNIKLNLDLSGLNFKIDPINVQIPAINIDFEEIKIDNIGELTAEVEIPVYEIDSTDPDNPKLVQTGVEKKKVNVDATSFKTAIEESINEALDQAGASLGKEIQEQLNNTLETQLNQAVGNIEGAVNDLIQNQLANEINGQLNTSIKDVIEQVKDQVTAGAGNYIDQANDYITKLNTWSGRFNNYMTRIETFLNNVNSKLHVTMMYNGEDGLLHQLSNSKAYPTVFTGEGAANVFVTSYTGEIIAPAFKKFIGVTNVFKDGDSAQNGCADCKAALDAVNDGEYFNEVFPGSRYGVAIENMKKGYTYEIFYSALDYSGKISARKFYVTVK